MRNARSVDDTTFQIYRDNGTPIVGGLYYKTEQQPKRVTPPPTEPAERINTNWVYVGKKKRGGTRARFVDQPEPEEADE